MGIREGFPHPISTYLARAGRRHDIQPISSGSTTNRFKLILLCRRAFRATLAGLASVVSPATYP